MFRNNSRQLAMLAQPLKARHTPMTPKRNPDKRQQQQQQSSLHPRTTTWLPLAMMNQPSPYTMRPSGPRCRQPPNHPIPNHTAASTWLNFSPCSPVTSNVSAKSPSVPTRTTSSGFKTSSITPSTSSKSNAYVNSTPSRLHINLSPHAATLFQL